MRLNRLLIPVLALTIAGCTDSGSPEPTNAADANAQERANGQATAANAADSIRTRQQHYKEIGRAMKAMGDEARKPSPDLALIQANAATIDRLAPQIKGWFPDGSGAEAGLKTEARAEIWSKPQEFQQAAERLAEEAARFRATTGSGDPAAIRDGMRALGGACKNCHDQFRAEHD